MSKVIEDIKDGRQALQEAIEAENAMREMQVEEILKNTDERRVIKSLYDRHVPFSSIFGAYYELEEQGNGRMMTVADAELACAPVNALDCA